VEIKSLKIQYLHRLDGLQFIWRHTTI